MSFSGREHPPSPRTLHERLGLDEHQQHQTPLNTLLDRVQGVKESSEGRATSAHSAAWSAQKRNHQDTASIVGQDGQPASATATPLEARIAQNPMTWLARGRQAPYTPAVRQPPASSRPLLDYGEDGRHVGPSSTSFTDARSNEAASSSHSTEEGRIRVSEDGEVWRSPPQRPVQHAARSTQQTGSSATSAPSSLSLSQSIDLTAASENKDTGRPGFSPLPPFARASSGSGSNEAVGPYRGVPAQGFRRPSGVHRAASRPPQIANSSGSSRYNTNKFSTPHRTSLPCPSMPSYQERQHTRAQAPSTDNETSGYDSYSNQAQGSFTYHNERPGSEPHRSPAILASPASSKGSQVLGEAIPIDTSAARSKDSHGNRTWNRPPTPHRPIPDDAGRKDITPKSPTPADRPSTSSGLQTSKLVAESPSSTSPAPSTSSVPSRSGANVKVEPKSAAFYRPPSSSSSAVTSTTAIASPSSSAVQSSTAQGNRCVGKDGFKQPLPATNAIKREPRSPPSVPRISLPPQPSNTTPQALFNPFTQSPEERKPVVRLGFTPPPRPRFNGNSSETQNAVSRKPSPPAASRQGRPLLARDVAEAHGERVHGQAGERNVVAVKGSSPQPHIMQTEVPRQMHIASTSRIDFASDSRLIPSQLERSIDRSNNPTSATLPSQSTTTGVSWDNWQPEMEVDELAPSSPVEPAAQLDIITAAARTRNRDIPTYTLSPPPHASFQSVKSAPLSTSSAQGIAPSGKGKGKGKERARDPLPTSSASRTGIPFKPSSAQVIDLASEDDEDEIESVEPSLSRKALNPGAVSPIQTNPLPSLLPAGVPAVAAVRSPSIPLRPVPGEERTRAFPLTPKVLVSIQSGAKRPRAALRNFLDGRYEELEVELKSPLRRIDEIPRDNTIRLVYIELELASNEVAIPLPRDCLRLNGSSSEEREQRRSAFQIQQIVRFAKEGKEAETTRFTPAYLIVVFQTGQQPLQSTSANSIAQQTASQRAPTNDAPTSSIPLGIADELAKSHLSSEIQKEKEKKRKRLSKGGPADDTASISSLDSTESDPRKRDKGHLTKQARKSIESQTVSGPSRSIPNLSSTSTSKPIALPQKPQTAPALVQQTTGGSSSAETRLTLGKPRHLKGIVHSMYGSHSNKPKGSLEKPRGFFRSERVGKGYIVVSMRGHLHYWHSGMDKSTVISEDRHAHVSLSIQAALWSDEHRLAILAHTSTSAAAIANIQIVKILGSKAASANRRTFLPANQQEDKTGLSALAWDPSLGNGLRMAGAEQTDRRLRLWSVDPGDSTKDATLTCLHNITTRHTNAIRSILWQPERNQILTAGADKRVCTIDPLTCQTVDEWKENLPVNRIYRRDANLILLCLAGNRDQFRCIDLRTPRSVTAITFSQPTKKGENLGQYPHGDIMNDYFAFPVEDDLHIWDLRSTRHLISLTAFSGVVQAHYETTTKLTLLEKRHFTTLEF